MFAIFFFKKTKKIMEETSVSANVFNGVKRLSKDNAPIAISKEILPFYKMVRYHCQNSIPFFLKQSSTNANFQRYKNCSHHPFTQKKETRKKLKFIAQLVIYVHQARPLRKICYKISRIKKL
jgi:hypothetical protein